MINCNKCGSGIHEGSKFCPACGATVIPPSPPPPPVPPGNEGTVGRHPSLDQLISGSPVPRSQVARASGGGSVLPTILASAGLVLTLVVLILMIRWNGQQSEENKKLQQGVDSLQKSIQLADARMAQSDNRIAGLQSDVQVMQDHMGLTEAELKRAQALAQQLQTEQQRHVRALSSQIAAKADTQEVQTIKTESETKIAGVSQDVQEVKEEVRTSKEELEKAKSELTRLGVVVTEQGGMIATNQTGLNELRRRGERDFFTFDIRKKQKMSVAGIGLELRKADVKKQYVDFRVSVDDRTMEQKQIYVNRPINFYAGRDRVPYEVVINEVRKDQMVGYISVPKGFSAPTAVLNR
jgi:hypothetical protein